MDDDRAKRSRMNRPARRRTKRSKTLTGLDEQISRQRGTTRILMMLMKPCLCLSGSSNRKCLYNHHAAVVPERRAAQLTPNNCALVCVLGTGEHSRWVDRVALRSSSGAFCHCGPQIYPRIEQMWPALTFPSGDRRPNGARPR